MKTSSYWALSSLGKILAIKVQQSMGDEALKHDFEMWYEEKYKKPYQW